LTEWQMYAQKIEGDSWRGEKLDKGKIDKMSGIDLEKAQKDWNTDCRPRPTAGAALRVDASYTKDGSRWR